MRFGGGTRFGADDEDDGVDKDGVDADDGSPVRCDCGCGGVNEVAERSDAVAVVVDGPGADGAAAEEAEDEKGGAEAEATRGMSRGREVVRGVGWVRMGTLVLMLLVVVDVDEEAWGWEGNAAPAGLCGRSL